MVFESQKASLLHSTWTRNPPVHPLIFISATLDLMEIPCMTRKIACPWALSIIPPLAATKSSTTSAYWQYRLFYFRSFSLTPAKSVAFGKASWLCTGLHLSQTILSIPLSKPKVLWRVKPLRSCAPLLFLDSVARTDGMPSDDGVELDWHLERYPTHPHAVMIANGVIWQTYAFRMLGRNQRIRSTITSKDVAMRLK